MKHIITLLLLQILGIAVYSQECKDYWNQNGIVTINDSYTIIPDACMSKLLATDESFEIPFKLIQCKDYKMSLFTTLHNKAHVTLYDRNNGTLIYNNTLNDTAQVIEFQVKENCDVRAVISLPNTHGKKTVGALTEKTKRYCVGLKMESMITRR